MIDAIDKTTISIKYLSLQLIHDNKKVSPIQFKYRKDLKNRWQCVPPLITFSAIN